ATSSRLLQSSRSSTSKESGIPLPVRYRATPHMRFVARTALNASPLLRLSFRLSPLPHAPAPRTGPSRELRRRRYGRRRGDRSTHGRRGRGTPQGNRWRLSSRPTT
ncbi:hypothetical protein HKX48_002742, partial [Thoreauomyces humboldtii]